MTVLENPVVSVTASATNICDGETVTFIANVTNGGTTPTFQWQVNGSPVPGATNSVFSSSTLANASQVNVVVTGTNGCPSGGTASTAINITVKPSPTVTLTASANPACTGATVSFVAQSNNAGMNPNYIWLVNNVIVPGISGPNYSSSNLTNGDIVTVRVVSADGCTSVVNTNSQVVMSIQPSPLALIGSQNPQCLISNGVVNSFNFTHNGTLGASYQWQFGSDATPQTSNLELPPPVTFSTAGTKQVILTVTLNGCSASDTVLVQVKPRAVASFAVPATQCLTGNSYNFVANGTTNPTAIYQWNFGSTAVPSTSLQQNPSNIVFSTPGVKNVSLKVILNGCEHDTTIAVMVDPDI
ncbi:MAG: hypothetical protein NZ108_11055, partial [Bacteroidia bacterium]|nr:hypothetical protein [Bacteroidia bacterium]